jgi:lipoprotein-anchoring transpeptidase ErfK/SrfK
MCLVLAPWLVLAKAPWADDPGVPKDRDSVLRVQIFLDQHYFGPGKLDGAIGEFTHKAVVNFNYSYGAPDIYDWTKVVLEGQRSIPVLYAAFRIREELLAHVNPDLPEDPAEQEQFPAMAYRSLAELVAERFHTDEAFLARINPDRNLASLRVGDVVIVPNVRPFRIESVKTFAGYKDDPVLSRNCIVVDTTERMAAIYSADQVMLAAFPITPGKPEFIPVGEWEVVKILNTPSFRYDKQFLEEGVRGEEAHQIPPGPNSPVGILWCGLSKSGIGLHGTALPHTIGRSQSAGCVRFANWDAIRLPQLIRPGSRVIVR